MIPPRHYLRRRHFTFSAAITPLIILISAARHYFIRLRRDAAAIFRQIHAAIFIFSLPFSRFALHFDFHRYYF
jgi:hypothetical protein